MTYAIVSGAHVLTNGTGASSGINTTGGDFCVAGVTAYGGTSPIAPTITDSKGNSYSSSTVYGDGSTSFVQAAILYSQGAATVGSGHTFTIGGTTTSFQTSYVQAFSGGASSSADGSTGTYDVLGGGSSNAPTLPSMTPSQNNGLIVALTGNSDGTLTPTINGGFTITDSQTFDGSTHYGGALAYLIQTTATASSPTWTFSGTCSSAELQIAFKVPSGAANDDERQYPRGVHRGLLRGAA